jgi:hypothetical protein
MAANLKAGNKNDYDKSMAQAIENAFKEEWRMVMQNGDINSEPKPPAFNDQMRIMFVAVAQGVIQHLKENPDAFKITVNTSSGGGGNHTHTASLKIE